MHADLSLHLQRLLSVALASWAAPQRADARASSLVAQLDQLALTQPHPNGWARQSGERAGQALRMNGTLADAVLHGKMDMQELLRADSEYRDGSKRIYDVITRRHKQLRTAEAAGAPEGVWADEQALREYAAAATDIGTRKWVRQGIDWCADVATRHVLHGGAMKLGRRQANDASRALRGTPHSEEETDELMAAFRKDAASRDGRVKLLDVGSCGSLFASFEVSQSSTPRRNGRRI